MFVAFVMVAPNIGVWCHWHLPSWGRLWGVCCLWGVSGGSVVNRQSCHGHHDFRWLSYGHPT